jgi:hypothetical protein
MVQDTDNNGRIYWEIATGNGERIRITVLEANTDSNWNVDNRLFRINIVDASNHVRHYGVDIPLQNIGEVMSAIFNLIQTPTPQ